MKLLSYAEALRFYGSDHRLKTALAEKAIFKIEDGVYCDENNPPESAVICFAYPGAVITMLSAFYYHGLTDVIPETIDIAIKSSGRAPNAKNARIYYSPKGFHDQGKMTLDVHGFPIAVYSKERMLIELLRNKDSLPYDLYKEVLSNYRRIIASLDLRWIEGCLMGFPKQRLILRRLEEEVL